MICELCPRRCGAERNENCGSGFCGMPAAPVVARAAMHFWEEPCISGTRGSGTVFFSGCTLRCVFCQNMEISAERFGARISVSRLREIFNELIAGGAHNINLVSPTPYVPWILKALENPLPVPVVWNTGGYETVDTLRALDGKVQIYLPDLKYVSGEISAKYSGAGDYFEFAAPAVLEMFRQRGRYVIGDDGIMRSGVIIRHLMLPGGLEDTKRVIDWVAENFQSGDVKLSLMSQYTPPKDAQGVLARHVTKAEYRAACDYMRDCGIDDGFLQERTAAREEYTPPFDLTGVERSEER